MKKQKSKYIITLTLSIILFIGSIAAFWHGYRMAKKPVLAVLLFHEVVPNPEKPWETTQENLESIIEKFIQHKYKFIDPNDFEDMLNKGFEGRNVMITFDDGLEKEHKAVKILYEKYKIKSVMFLIDDFIDKPEYMTLETIRNLSRDYGMFCALHGKHHLKYTEQLKKGLDLGNITEESRVKLSKALGIQIKWLSFPFGDYNQKVLDEIKSKTAITHAFTIESGNINLGNDPITLNRYMYQANDTEDKIDTKITVSLLPPEEQENGKLLITISILVFMFGLSRLLLALKIRRSLDSYDE